jgi:16S rRNA (cytosine967-C5)-methyltransferase
LSLSVELFSVELFSVEPYFIMAKKSHRYNRRSSPQDSAGAPAVEQGEQIVSPAEEPFKQEPFKQEHRPQGRNANDNARERPKFSGQDRRSDGAKGNWRQDRAQSTSPSSEFIPAQGESDRPEDLEALRSAPLKFSAEESHSPEAVSAEAVSAQANSGAPRRGIPAPLRYDDPPYVPDKPARGSDDIFFTDFNPLYSGPRGLAIKILSRLDQSDSYLDKLLEHELAHSDLKPIDRALLTELVHGVTRWQAKLDWVLTGFYHGEFVKCIVPVKNAMRIALYQIMFLQRIPPFAAVNESVELVKRLKGARSANLVNAILRNILHNINNIRYPVRQEDVARHLSIVYSHPFWMTVRWIQRFGEAVAEDLLRANNERPKIALRVNRLRCKPEELYAFLDANEVKRWEAPLDKERMILVGSLSSIQEWKPFQDGWFSVQDTSAALVSRLANPQPGALVYDLCAAPGGKATAMAEQMNDEGKIIALDKYSGKLAIIRENAERLRLTCIQPQVGDARAFAPKELADVVLVDAPCSGLGTLARKSDIKWKFETAHFPQLITLQRQILANAAKLVKPGGALIYSTCTIEPEENTEQATWFLKEFPDFTLDAAENYLPEAACKDGFMQTFPHVHQTDGAFAARFVRAR